MERVSTIAEEKVPPKMAKEKTEPLLKDLSKLMGKEGSPLAISEALKVKGYDPDLWMDYIDKNRDEIDLTERQARELQKPRNFFPTLNDMWLFDLLGLNKLFGE